MKKESGVARTRTHGRGSVPLMSKCDTIPLRHKAETLDIGKTTKYIVTVYSNSNPIYIRDICLDIWWNSFYTARYVMQN